ncbi:TPA: hypothetical protein EYO12_03450 [Candidatus Saccharibacteria bacterium]|nr:hypothetical protein [Candidatus Saccharibacteria bacterium]HIO87912.1 hypothetical protein [Candidatus Saccharibacteria bacterium]
MRKEGHSRVELFIGLLRISLGFLFLWAFLDKFLGLGFTTCKDVISGDVEYFCSQAVVNGGAPAEGFLTYATQGPLASLFQSIASWWIVNALFIVGLLAIGVALMLGIGVTIAVYSGSLLMLLMYLAVLPPEHNPLLDEHGIYILSLFIILLTNDRQQLGLGKWWSNTKIVKRIPVLK